MSRHVLAAFGLACLLVSCVGETPNSGIGERRGAKGRIVGYLYDADTGAALSGVTVETMELGAKVSATSIDGYFTLDRLTASATYRLTFVSAGYVSRVVNVGIGQIPTDAYDAVSVANTGSIVMAKPSGSIKGRVEFANQTSGQAVPIRNANVIVDYAGQLSTFLLTLTATTDANGEFTLTGLPGSPQGIGAQVCVHNLVEDPDPVADFVPTCAGVTVYSNQTTPLSIRPQRYDLNNQDVNQIQGVVRDVLTRLPVDGVEVFEVGKEADKVTTDANGAYLLRTASVNRFIQVIYRKAAYAEGYLEFNLGRGGNNTGQNMTLFPGGASLEGRLTYANFQPAAQAEVRLDLRTSNSINVLQFVRTDAMGNFTVPNLPGQADGLNATVRVTPWSADPDLFPETQAQTFNVALYPGSKTSLFAQLASNANLTVIANNATSGFISTTEGVTLQLSLPSLPTDNSFTLTDNGSGQPMPFTVVYADSNRRVTVTPVVATGAPLWSENRSYSLQYRLRANNGPQGLTQATVSFTPRTSLATSSITGRITAVTLDNADIDAATRSFTLRWAPLPDAFSYWVYVRSANTNRLPSFVRIATAAAAASPSAVVNLGGNFAVLDAAQNQAFAFGQVLTFLVVAVDSRGIETDASRGATLDVRDVVAPRFDFGIAQLDGASGSSHPIRFIIRASEPMDRATPPTTTLPSGLTFTSWAVDETSGGIEGTLTLTGSLAAVANLSVQPRDTSANLGRALAVPVLQSALVPNQGFEGTTAGTCSSAGWTEDANVNCAACPAQALPTQPAANANLAGTLSVFEGSCAMSFGDPDATWCGLQQITAPMDLSGTTFDRRSVVFQYRYWPYFQAGNVTTRCDFFDTTSSSVAQLFQSASTSALQRQWNVTSANASNLIGRTGRVRCALDTSNVCGSRGGAQLDDFRVYVK